MNRYYDLSRGKVLGAVLMGVLLVVPRAAKKRSSNSRNSCPECMH